MTTDRDAIVAQAWTLLYRWAAEPTGGERRDLAMIRLFQLLEEADPESYRDVFRAGSHGEDFPAAVATKYPSAP